MAKILAFDTATEACTVALSINGEIYEQFEVAPRRHASLILPMIQHLLSAAEMNLSDLDAVAFGSGPGSFMGLRIAAGVAQALAFVANKPVIPVPTLQVIAHVAHLNTQEPQVLVGWDARMNEVYWGAYRCDDKGIMQAIQPDRVEKPEQIQLPLGHWLAAGNAWRVYEQSFSELVKSHIHMCTEIIYPHANAIVKLASWKFARGEVVTPAEAKPLYLRDNVANVPHLPI